MGFRCMLDVELTMDNTLLQTIQSLEQRAEKLEREAADLRRALGQVANELASPDAVVATAQVGTLTVEVTQSEVDVVRARLTRPRTEGVLREMALVYKIAESLPSVGPDEEEQQLLDLLDTYRQEAMAQGVALDDEEIEALLRGD